jgi:RNA polymerase sigma factor (sigma-70 family)
MAEVIELDRYRADRDQPADSGRAGALVRAAAAGDGTAWTVLVRQYSTIMVATARRFGLSEADTADVVQVVWLRLAENLGRLRDPDRIAGWLSTTARNECVRLTKMREQPTDSAFFDVPDAVPGPEALAIVDADKRELNAAFQRLSERDQRLLGLLMASPMPTYAEISREMKMPVGSIGPTRARALARLRAEYFGPQAA